MSSEIQIIDKKKTSVEKAKETRRKNNLQKQVIAQSLNKLVKAKYKVRVYDPETDTTKVVTMTGVQRIGERLMDIAVNKDAYSAKESLQAMEFIRDTIGEKPTEHKQVEGNFTFAWEQMVENITDDDD